MITAERDGVLSRLDALAVGVAAWRLGAGRAAKHHTVQAGAGVVLHAKPGDARTSRSAADHPARPTIGGPVRSGARSIGRRLTIRSAPGGSPMPRPLSPAIRVTSARHLYCEVTRVTHG